VSLHEVNEIVEYAFGHPEPLAMRVREAGSMIVYWAGGSRFRRRSPRNSIGGSP
jgi:hypothetical protein